MDKDRNHILELDFVQVGIEPKMGILQQVHTQWKPLHLFHNNFQQIQRDNYIQEHHFLKYKSLHFGTVGSTGILHKNVPKTHLDINTSFQMSHRLNKSDPAGLVEQAPRISFAMLKCLSWREPKTDLHSLSHDHTITN